MTRNFHQIFYLLCLSGLALLQACQSSKGMQSPALSAYFKASPGTDTLRFECFAESLHVPDTIPNQVFFTTIPSKLLREIDYLADSSQAIVLGRLQFPINHRISAYWVEIRQFWFIHHALLLYDRSKREFTERITLAEWYGGDGGQVLIESWMFDYNGDGKRDLLRQETHHSIQFDGDEPIEQTQRSETLLLWGNRRFKQVGVPKR